MNRRVQQWLFVVLVAIGLVGFASATPLGGGPDEPRHLQTAWEQSNLFPGQDGLHASQDGTLWPVDPNMPWDAPCFALDSRTNAGCIDRHVSYPASDVVVFNYPPPYYWFVGAFQRLAAGSEVISAGTASRLASFLLNCFVLGLVAANLRRLTGYWGVALVAVLPPAALFQMVIINANGLEISAALLFAVTYFRARQSRPAEFNPWISFVSPALAGLLLAISRPLGFVWLILIWIGVEVLNGRRGLYELDRSTVSPVLGAVAGFAWVALVPPEHPISTEAIQGDPGVSDYLQWMLLSAGQLTQRILDMGTLLGWNDTTPPLIVSFVLVALWISFFAIALWRRQLPLLFALFAALSVALVPIAIEVYGWVDYPQWWQARYSLPMASAVLLVGSLHVLPKLRGLLTLIAWSQVTLVGLLVLLNLFRYSYGLDGFLPIFVGSPEIPKLNFGVALVSGSLLLVLGAVGSVRQLVGWQRFHRKTAQTDVQLWR